MAKLSFADAAALQQPQNSKKENLKTLKKRRKIEC